MECKIKDNTKKCNCTYPCPRKGLCCDCIAYHRSKGQLPACYFNDEDERTYNRSIEFYLSRKGN